MELILNVGDKITAEVEKRDRGLDICQKENQ